MRYPPPLRNFENTITRGCLAFERRHPPVWLVSFDEVNSDLLAFADRVKATVLIHMADKNGHTKTLARGEMT